VTETSKTRVNAQCKQGQVVIYLVVSCCMIFPLFSVSPFLHLLLPKILRNTDYLKPCKAPVSNPASLSVRMQTLRYLYLPLPRVSQRCQPSAQPACSLGPPPAHWDRSNEVWGLCMNFFSFQTPTKFEFQLYDTGVTWGFEESEHCERNNQKERS